MPVHPKRIFVLLSNDLFTDQRVHKVCLYLLSKGFEPVLLGRKLPSSKSMNERPYQWKRFRLWFKSGALFYANLNFKLFTFLLFRKTPWILANDLDTLPAGYLISKIHRKTKLVYDTHEFFTGVPELVNRPSVQRIWTIIEAKMFRNIDRIYTVNQSIANKYNAIYGNQVAVLRNIAPLKNDFSAPDFSTLGISKTDFVVIFQGAGINVDRGGEELVEAMQLVHGAVLLILGHGDAIQGIKSFVDEHDLGDKVKFGDKMPYDEMMNWPTSLKLDCLLTSLTIRIIKCRCPIRYSITFRPKHP